MKLKILLLGAMSLALSACEASPTAESQVAAQTQQQLAAAQTQIGLPAVTRFRSESTPANPIITTAARWLRS